jgi:hypothetical protein
MMLSPADREAADGGAALAADGEGGGNDLGGGIIQITIVGHDCRILPAHLQLHLGEMPGRHGLDPAPDRRGAREADPTHQGITADRISHGASAPGDQGRNDLPQRGQNRKIPGVIAATGPIGTRAATLVTPARSLGMVIPSSLRPSPAFKKANPHVEMTVVEEGSLSIGTHLERGELDIGIMITSNLPAKLASMPIGRGQIMVCLPPAHPLAKHPRISFDMLRDEPFQAR